MTDNEEIISFNPAPNEKKKKSNYRAQKDAYHNKNSYKISSFILLIIVFAQFIFILYLLFYSKNNFNNPENTYINNTINNIMNNTKEEIITIIPTTETGYINIGKFEYKKEEYKTYKNAIHIAMACDNGAVYSSLVSMASALENNNKEKNILIYHLLLSNDFDMNKLGYFESLKDDYEFILNYVKIPPIFKYIKKKWRNTETVQYKLLLPLLYPDIPRMIFLDGDTLVFTDILEMYNLDFKDNYILGYPYHTADSLDGWVKEHLKVYINCGVLLFNIDKIRQDNMDLKLLEFHQDNFHRTNFLEQDSLNYLYQDKIGFLPLKYGIYLFGNIEEYKKTYLFKMRVELNFTEMESALEKPSIVHLCCCNPKVWYKNTRQEKGYNHICYRFQEEFYFYANKTKFYNEIYNSYMK